MSRFAFDAALATVVLVCSLTVQADVVLSPLSMVAASSGGLTGNWFKVKDDAKISDVMYTDKGGTTQAIKDFGWGTGIWSIQDLAAATNPANGWVQATATTTSAVSFANNYYNALVGTPVYGSWAQDMDRPLVPASMGETNFVALFSGYLYVWQTGLHIGVFGDDGFSLTLTGADGNSSAPLVKSAVVDSPGRELLEMNDLTLGIGFYGISLDYFNRLESGVIDLVWRTDDSDWQTIDSSHLYAVPEPGSLMLMVLALVSLWAVRRHPVSH